MLCGALEDEGYKVSTAENGLIAIDVLKTLTPDLIITDVIMQGMDGFEVITQVKNQNPDIKIIAISGGGMAGPKTYLEIAEDLGADYTITKPSTLKEFLSAVNKLLK